MQIRLSICVRCTGVEPSPETPKRESPTARRYQTGRGDGRGRSRSATCRATRLHAHASRSGARSEPLNIQPPCPSIDRNGRDALGNEAHPGRRTRAIGRRTAAASSGAGGFGRTRSAASPPTPRCGPHPSRARSWENPPSDRRCPQRSASADGTRWLAMVAVHRARRSQSG
jgi:hypothetical protein